MRIFEANENKAEPKIEENAKLVCAKNLAEHWRDVRNRNYLPFLKTALNIN